MNWERFDMFRAGLDRLDVKPLLGVIPDNQDPTLRIDPPAPDFWDQIRSLAANGWCISQHGYTHVYTTSNRGMLGIGRKSEFAGIPRDRQRQMLSAGRQILAGEGLSTGVFMAPSHSFDMNTLFALKETGFTALTDGHGLWPYRAYGLIFVPQLFATPKTLGDGIYTVCLHLNEMSEASISKLLSFVEANRSQFIRFEDALDQVKSGALASLWRPYTRVTIRALRMVRGAFRK